jgi:hypothetical protein
MNNTTARILLAAVAAGALIYTVNRRRRNRTWLERTRHQAQDLTGNFIGKASKMGDSASDLMALAASVMKKGRAEAKRQRHGVLEAIDAGKAAYQRVTG